MAAVDKILRMAVEELADAVPAKRAVQVTEDAAKAALDKVAGATDDWGWKGGKPGEMTGSLFEASRTNMDVSRGLSSHPSYPAIVQLEELAARNPSSHIARRYLARLNANKPRPSMGYAFTDDQMRLMSAGSIMEDFADLEDADVPRAWTGKILEALGGRLPGKPGEMMIRRGDRRRTAQQVSDLMRPMTNSQRDTFLSLLPEWEGSLEDLAVAARSFAN